MEENVEVAWKLGLYRGSGFEVFSGLGIRA